MIYIVFNYLPYSTNSKLFNKLSFFTSGPSVKSCTIAADCTSGQTCLSNKCGRQQIYSKMIYIVEFCANYAVYLYKSNDYLKQCFSFQTPVEKILTVMEKFAIWRQPLAVRVFMNEPKNIRVVRMYRLPHECLITNVIFITIIQLIHVLLTPIVRITNPALTTTILELLRPVLVI